jgi:multidrug efflux pump subunit AcrA (membrane-fusion protein)
VQVRGTFDNSNRVFRPGLFARVRVPAGSSYSALLVNETAVGTDQGQKFVLTVNEQNVVDRRFVKPGPLQDDGLRVISEGLKSGEWVVVNGLQRARVGKPVAPQKSPMPSRKVASTSAAPVPEPSKPAPPKPDDNN